MKTEHDFWMHLYGLPPEEIPEEVDFLPLSHEPIDDRHLDWLTKRIKRIRRLDLKETDITDEGVAFLSRLESLLQLNLNGTYVTELAIPYLIRMPQLEYLYINDHPLPLDEILKLGRLKKLENLFFAVEDGVTEADLLPLYQVLPNCDIVILNE